MCAGMKYMIFIYPVLCKHNHCDFRTGKMRRCATMRLDEPLRLLISHVRYKLIDILSYRTNYTLMVQSWYHDVYFTYVTDFIIIVKYRYLRLNTTIHIVYQGLNNHMSSMSVVCRYIPSHQYICIFQMSFRNVDIKFDKVCSIDSTYHISDILRTMCFMVIFNVKSLLVIWASRIQ